MKFHLFVPQMRMTHDAIVERARAAEAAGFEGIAFMDHLAPPLAASQGMWDAMTTATWVLAHTTTLQVGHLVLFDSLRHPSVLAREVTSVDHASGGRFELGIGWGSVPEELEVFGLATGGSPPRERVERLGDSLTVMRALWSGEVVDHRGTHFTLRGAQQQPTPTRRVPITIGGVGNRTLELVREHADWWNVPVHHLDRIDELRPRAGDARVSVQSMMALVPDESQRDEIEATVQRRFGATGMGANLVVGNPSELAEHVEGLATRGVERVYVWFADFAPVPTLERFAEVISA